MTDNRTQETWEVWRRWQAEPPDSPYSWVLWARASSLATAREYAHAARRDDHAEVCLVHVTRAIIHD